MVTKKIVIGGQAKEEPRPAAMLVQVASRFESSIYIELPEKRVNAKSIMGAMTLELLPGAEVTAVVNGPDEAEAAEEIEKFLVNTK